MSRRPQIQVRLKSGETLAVDLAQFDGRTQAAVRFADYALIQSADFPDYRQLIPDPALRLEFEVFRVADARAREVEGLAPL